MSAHSIRALILVLGHGAMLISVGESGARTIAGMRQRQDPAAQVTDTHQFITWMSVLVALLLLSAFFAVSDEPTSAQKGLLWFSLAGFIAEMVIVCRVWML